MHLSMHLWLCVFVVSPGRWFFRLKSSLWSYPWPIGSKVWIIYLHEGWNMATFKGEMAWQIFPTSGQIIIFHQPRFPWNKGFPLLNHLLGWGRLRSLLHGSYKSWLSPTISRQAKIRPPPAWKYRGLPGRELQMGSGPIGPTKSLKVSYLLGGSFHLVSA